MTTPTTNPKLDNLIERLAAIEHERWADWQRWMHKVLRDTHDPSPEYGDILERWDRQIETPYNKLSEGEKQSDRDQVQRYMPLLKQTILSDLLAAIPDEKVGTEKIPLDSTELGYNIAIQDVKAAIRAYVGVES